jgi:hypothetical protein
MLARLAAYLQSQGNAPGPGDTIIIDDQCIVSDSIELVHVLDEALIALLR